MQYDVVSKLLLERCKEVFLSYFLGMDVDDAELLELRPQETVSSIRSDFVIRVRRHGGGDEVLVIEFQTRWERLFPLRLLEYKCRQLLKGQGDMPVTSVGVILRPSSSIVDGFEDHELSYRFRLIKLFEMEARELVRSGPDCLLPLVPVMRGGEDMVDEAEERIYRSSMDRGVKSESLMGLAIFSGLISRELPLILLERRRDMITESATYDILREEILKEGIQQGLKEGIQQGMLQEARELVLEALEERFGVVPASVADVLETITNRGVLKGLLRKAIRVRDIDEFKELLQQALQ